MTTPAFRPTFGRAIRSTLVLLLLSVLASGPASAQEGSYRLERQDAQGRPSSGLLVVTRGPAGLRYERRTRDTLDVPCVVERGSARLDGGALVLTPEQTGLAGAISGGSAADVRFAPDGAGFARAGERLVAIPAAQAGNDVRLLVDSEAFASVRAEVRAATSSVDFQVFHYADDATGRSIADALKERAAAGVPVRLLVDAQSKTIGKLVHGKAHVDIVDGLDAELRQAGVQVVLQHGRKEELRGTFKRLGRKFSNLVERIRGRTPSPTENRGFNIHDHRKYTVIDQRVGFLGGQNVGVDYESKWHDVQVRLEGPAVTALRDLFADRWQAAGGAASTVAPRAQAGAGDVQVEVLGYVPGLADPIQARYLTELRAARDAKLALAFVDDDEALEALTDVARRGGKAVLLVPNDAEHVNVVVRDALLWVLNDMTRAGVEIYKLDRMLHLKLGLFDGETTIVGSDNLSGSNLAESVAVVTDPRFARVVQARLFDVDLPRSTKHVVRKLTFGERARSFAMRFIVRHIF